MLSFLWFHHQYKTIHALVYRFMHLFLNLLIYMRNCTNIKYMLIPRGIFKEKFITSWTKSFLHNLPYGGYVDCSVCDAAVFTMNRTLIPGSLFFSSSTTHFLPQETFPKRFPFSLFVPNIYTQVKAYINACLKFSADLHLRYVARNVYHFS